MKQLIFLLALSLFCLSCSTQKRAYKRSLKHGRSASYVDPREIYGNNKMYADTSLRGYPYLDNFKTNRSIEIIGVDEMVNKNFISRLFRDYLSSEVIGVRQYKIRNHFVVLYPRLKSGAYIMFDRNNGNGYEKFFVVYKNYYYISISRNIVTIHYKRDDQGNIILPLYEDPYKLTDHTFDLLRDLVK